MTPHIFQDGTQKSSVNNCSAGIEDIVTENHYLKCGKGLREKDNGYLYDTEKKICLEDINALFAKSRRAVGTVQVKGIIEKYLK